MEKQKRERKYLTIDRFENFVTNEFAHVSIYAKASFWVSLTILAAIIGRYIIG